MRFPYLALTMRQPVYPLGGATVRHSPIISVSVTGPAGTWARDCLVDSAADDTVFPDTVAQRVGIDLTGAPQGSSRQVGGGVIAYSYASVTLRVSDGREECEWEAIVGFVAVPIRWPLLGQTAFFQFFDVLLRGAAHEVVLTPNASFAGQHIVP